MFKAHEGFSTTRARLRTLNRIVADARRTLELTIPEPYHERDETWLRRTPSGIRRNESFPMNELQRIAKYLPQVRLYARYLREQPEVLCQFIGTFTYLVDKHQFHLAWLGSRVRCMKSMT